MIYKLITYALALVLNNWAWRSLEHVQDAGAATCILLIILLAIATSVEQERKKSKKEDDNGTRT